MKLPKLKNIKKKLKPMLSAIKSVSVYAKDNALGLVNLSLLLRVLFELESIQSKLDMTKEMLGKIYIEVLQAVGFDVMLTIQLIQKLLGGEES